LHDETYEVGELVKVKLFGTRIRKTYAFTYPYASYGIVVAEGMSHYDNKEGYYVYVQKLEKIEFFKIEWMKKVKPQGKNNESNV